jgi:hypothetical protein
MITIINNQDKTAHIFTNKTRSAKYLNVHRNTVNNWHIQADYKLFKSFDIYFNTTLTKGSQRGLNQL